MAFKSWYMRSFGWDDLQSTGSEAWSWDDIPSGATLIRSVVSVYVAGIGFVPTFPANGVPAPVAWVLVETNSTINPTPPALDPFGIVGSGHVLGGKMVALSYSGATQRFSTTGTSDEDTITHITTYDQLHTDTAYALMTGNSYEDSHAQRFFPEAAPAFVIEVKPGFVSARFGDLPYAGAATVKQLFEIR